jgi:hypothetical protein
MLFWDANDFRMDLPRPRGHTVGIEFARLGLRFPRRGLSLKARSSSRMRRPDGMTIWTLV